LSSAAAKLTSDALGFREFSVGVDVVAGHGNAIMSFLEDTVSRLSISQDVKILSAKVDKLVTLLEQMQTELRTGQNISGLRSNPAAEFGFKGDQSNDVYRGFVGGDRPLSATPSVIPLTSTLCQQLHFSMDQYRFWICAIKDRVRYHRKLWEYFYIAQVLFERDMLRAGRRGIGFGVGREPLPALFASFGVEVVATDQSLEGAVRAGWARSNQHTTDLSILNERGICTERMFGDLVSFAEADMNDIDHKFDGQFDFCWSSCSFEHLGSLRHGMEFVKNSIRTLKPGGVAVHTTEFNLSSNDATHEQQDLSIYRRRDIDQLIAELSAEGCIVSPIDYTLGDGFAETVIDLPPYGRGEPHLRLRIAEFDCTSVGLIVQKAEK
jgi:SAM-dependent methyltransferase